MRINELLESVEIDLDNKGEHNDRDELDYDLADDLVFFMNHNDDVYRRYTFPAVTKCLDRINANKNTHPSLFKIAVLQSFKDYANEYPDRKLPESLDDKLCLAACKKIHEETCKHAEEGKYKD
jgi:hypothetical protein